MKRHLILSVMLVAGSYAMACTNFIVGKKASADGSVFVTYNADSFRRLHAPLSLSRRQASARRDA